MSENIIFIRLLEYGELNHLQGTNESKLKEWARSENIYSSVQAEPAEWSLLRDLFFECFVRNSNSTADMWVLKAEYYFRLLEWRELQESRIASKQANRNSFFAIAISLIAIFVTVGLGYFQMNKPIELSSSTISSLRAERSNP